MKLEELKKLCDEATPGPWKLHYADRRYWVERDGQDEHVVCRVEGENIDYRQEQTDAHFIAAAREALPKLIAVAEAAFDNGMRCGNSPQLRATLAALESDV